MERSNTLQDVLKLMKVTDVFQDEADLSGLSADKGIQLTQVKPNQLNSKSVELILKWTYSTTRCE